jgi:predicted transcriptional regulator
MPWRPLPDPTKKEQAWLRRMKRIKIYADEDAAMNAMTTIRVEAAVRDRLATLAEAHGRSLGAELAAILDDLEWEAIEAGYRRLAAKPDDLATYLTEAEAFSRVA